MPTTSRVTGRASATVRHGAQFSAIVQRDNIVAVAVPSREEPVRRAAFPRRLPATLSSDPAEEATDTQAPRSSIDASAPDMRPVLVTTRQYRDALEVGDPVSQAKIYEAQLADELIVLNIDGTPDRQGRASCSALIERLATETFMPLAVGGGVRDGRATSPVLLERGADKVCINTRAFRSPGTRSARPRRRYRRAMRRRVDRFPDRCAAGRAIVHTATMQERTEHDGVVEWAVRGRRGGCG